MDGAKKRSAKYTDRSLSGVLTMKAPLCLSRGGLVEVGLGKKDFGSDSWAESGLKRGAGKGAARRLIYVGTVILSLTPPILSFPFTLFHIHSSYPEISSGQAAQIHGRHSTKAKTQTSQLTY